MFLQETMSNTCVTLGSSRFKNISVSETPCPPPSPNYLTPHSRLPAWLVQSLHIVPASDCWGVGGWGRRIRKPRGGDPSKLDPTTKRRLPLSPHINHIQGIQVPQKSAHLKAKS